MATKKVQPSTAKKGTKSPGSSVGTMIKDIKRGAVTTALDKKRATTATKATAPTKKPVATPKPPVKKTTTPVKKTAVTPVKKTVTTAPKKTVTPDPERASKEAREHAFISYVATKGPNLSESDINIKRRELGLEAINRGDITMATKKATPMATTAGNDLAVVQRPTPKEPLSKREERAAARKTRRDSKASIAKAKKGGAVKRRK